MQNFKDKTYKKELNLSIKIEDSNHTLEGLIDNIGKAEESSALQNSAIALDTDLIESWICQSLDLLTLAFLEIGLASLELELSRILVVWLEK